MTKVSISITVCAIFDCDVASGIKKHDFIRETISNLVSEQKGDIICISSNVNEYDDRPIGASPALSAPYGNQ